MLNNQAGIQHGRCTSKRVTVKEVYCDFDGTITCIDATDAVLEAFALPAWREWEQRWVRGEITSQQCLSRQVELIQADRETLIQFVTDIPIDEGILALDRRCAEQGVPLPLVSDGFDLIVEAVLRQPGLLHLPIFSTHLPWDQQEHPAPTLPIPAQGGG